ncbi:MAG: hypothetical protein KC414_14195, partial [Romboutsia sp.]|nr:hypothetical protein [Romboutsia sp.]
ILGSKGDFYPSYLTTKNIPFAPLDGYLPYYKNFLINNIVFDLPHSSYVPVQTRTKIRTSKDLKNNFMKADKMAMFINLLYLFYDEPRRISKYIDNMFSTANIDCVGYLQVAPSFDQNVNNILGSYSFQGLDPINFIINKCIKFLIKNKVSFISMNKNQAQRLNRIIKRFNSNNKEINKLVHHLIESWLQNKGPPTEQINKLKSNTNDEIDEIDEESDEESDKTIDDKLLQKHLELWVNTYWNIAVREKIEGYTNPVPPKVKVVINPNARQLLGLYKSKEYEIIINTVRFSDADRIKIIKLFNSKNFNYIQNSKDEKLNKLVAYTFPSCTLAHELEHARRHQSHKTQGSHT